MREEKTIPQYCIFMELTKCGTEWVSQAKYIMVSRFQQLLLGCVLCTIQPMWSQLTGSWLKWLSLPESGSAAASRPESMGGVGVISSLPSSICLFVCLIFSTTHELETSDLFNLFSFWVLAVLTFIFHVLRFQLAQCWMDQPGHRFFQKAHFLINRLRKWPLLAEYYIFKSHFQAYFTLFFIPPC